jgi:suppressor of G2 allele of SKP1
MALLARANQLLCDENYEAAKAAFDDALDDERSAAGYAGRAAIHLKNEKFTAALQDANAALASDDACEPALYRKGLACFQLDEFETALDAFRRGLALAEASPALARSRKYAIWLRKCDAEIEDESSDEDEDAAGAAAHADTPPAAPIATAPAPEGGVVAAPCAIKYQYYQTNSHITITVLAKNVQAGECVVEIKERTLVCKVAQRGTEQTVISGELYDPVLESITGRRPAWDIFKPLYLAEIELVFHDS